MTSAATHSRDDAPPTAPRGRPAALAFAVVRCAALALALGMPLPLPTLALATSAETDPPVATASELEFTPFHDQAFIEARKSGQPLVLYFEADWCVPCKKMHAETFRSPAVVEAAAGIRFFRVDLTNPDTHLDRVRKSFRVIGAPTVVLFGPDGKESGHRFGFIPADDFVEMLGKSRKAADSTRLDAGPLRALTNVAAASS